MGNSEYLPFTVPAMKIDKPEVIRFTRATRHPLRIAILQRLEEVAHGSPKELSEHFEMPLGVVSYHVNELAQYGSIALVKTEPRRGAAEHFYRINDYGKTVLRCAGYITRKVAAVGEGEAVGKVEAAG
jgi:DNA-binding transcriptional ArsR family regulator